MTLTSPSGQQEVVIDGRPSTYNEQSAAANETRPVGAEPAPKTSVIEKLQNSRQSIFRFNRAAFVMTGTALVVMVLIGLGSLFAIGGHSKNQKTVQSINNYATSNLSVGNIQPSGQQLQIGQADNLQINGRLEVSNTLVLLPTSQPKKPMKGQFYYDQSSNVPYFYNGSQFVSLAPEHVTSLGGADGVITLGNGLSVVNNQLEVATTLIQQINTQISNAAASGVLSLAGTANQVNVSSSTGNITLSLPQDIATSSAPTFQGLTVGGFGAGLVQSSAAGVLSSGVVDRNDGTYLSGILSVPNGGTGAASFTTNGILYGNGAGALQPTNSLANAALVTDGAGVPSLSQTLPFAVQDNITHTGALVSGSITAGFGTISTVNNITTTALIQAGSLEVDGGSFQVLSTGALTAQSATIQGSDGVTIGVAGSTTGNLVLANSLNSHLTTVEAISPATFDQTITIPASTAPTDTVCLMTLANCVGVGGAVSASGGIQNYITKFTNAAGDQIGNSLLYDNGTSVGVGTAVPGASYLLDVNGNLHAGGSGTLDNTLTVTAGGASITGDINQTGTGALTTGSGAVTLNGATSITGTSTLTVGTGATTLGGTLGVTDTATLSGGANISNGATITGATNINISGTANTFIGNATGTLGLTSSTFSLSTGGAISGVTGYSQTSGNFTQSGTGTFSTGTGNVSLNGAVTAASTLAVQGAGGLTLGVPSTTDGKLTFANSANGFLTSIVSAAQANDLALTIPADTNATDTLCLFTLSNCAASGAAGGDLTGSYPNPSIAKLQGTTLTIGTPVGGDILLYNGSAWVNQTVSGDITISSTGVATIGAGKVTNADLVNSSLSVNAGTGLTGGGSVSLGGSTSLSVAYGNTAGTAVQGNTNLTCPSGTGNLTGGGNSFFLGDGGTCNSLTVVNSPTFSGSLTVQGSGGITVGVPGTTTGSITLATLGSATFTATLQSATQANNVTVTLPADTNAADTLCLQTLDNCGATGAAGGDLTGTYPNPTIAKLQGYTLTLSAPASGDVLQYNGTAWVNGLISNSNLTAGTYGNITGTGALTSGSIASGFGTISTGNNITTTATVQGGTVNATTAIQLNGANINTGGTLTNVAYLDQANNFSAANTFSAAGTALSVTNNASVGGTLTSGALNVTGASGITVGTAGFGGAAGVISLANTTNSNLSVIESSAPTGVGNATYSLPAIAGGSSDTICVVSLNNCGASGPAGGDLTGTYPNPTIAKLQGYTLTLTAPAGGDVLLYNGTAWVNQTVTGDVTISSGGVTTIGAGKVTNADLVNSSLSVNAGTGLTGGGSVSLGGSTSLSVAYGSTAGTAVEGNTTLVCPSGTGNLTGGGNSVTLGTGGTCNSLDVVSSPTFSGNLTVQGASGITIGVPGVGGTAGVINLANTTNTNLSIISAAAPTGVGNATYGLPAIAGGTSDTICLFGLANCAASGTAGGDLTGTYPNPTIAKLQGTTLTLSSLAAGDVLQYNGTAIVNGHITNSNLTAGTFSNITGVGALGTGSITNGFGTITTGNNITTTATVQGGIVNATSALELNGTDINSAGTLTNVAYKNQANTFTASQTVSGGFVYVDNNTTTNPTLSRGLAISNNRTAGGGEVDFFSNKSGGTTGGYKFYDWNGTLATSLFTIDGSGNTTAAGTVNGATISGGTISGGTLSATAVNGLSVSGGTITSPTITGTVTGSASPTITGFGTYNGQTISSSANFTGTLAVATSVATPLLNLTSGSFTVGVQSATQANSLTVSVPADTNVTDTFCLQTLANCSFSGTAAGGDLTGTYPNPTIASLQGTTLTLSGLASGDVLQYNGTAIVNGHITNSNLTAGTFSSITGTGALTAGSIASGFGTISTGNNITTTATVQGGTVNATTAIQLNGANINTAGTLTNVAYLNASNTFTGATNTFSATGGNSVAITGAPTNLATTSLIRIGNAIASGNNSANGGTYLGLNEPSTGAGSAADFINFQNNGTSKFKVTSTGVLTAASTINGATISGGTISGGTLSATAVNGLSVSGGTITSPTITGTVTGSASPTITGFGTYNGQTISSSANFTGTLAVNGSTLTIGTAGTTAGAIDLTNATNTNLSVISATAPTGIGGNATYTLPAIAGGSSDTFCLLTLGNCSGATGAAGGDLTGTYPNPTIASLQGNTLTITTPTAGDVLQYNGTAFINGHITNANLTAGTFSAITGVGALTAGSIGGSFGSISTGNNITTTATVQGGTVNATSTIQLNGTNINTGGTLTNVAYLDQSNTFTGVTNTFSATGGNSVAITGAPTNSATSSLIRIGNAIASGNTTVNGGTYLGLNEPSTGAGSAADFINFQNNGTSKFKVTSTGVLTAAGTINGATISGGTLSGGSVSGGTLTATAVNGLSVSGGTITSPTITGTVTGTSSPTITGFGTYNSQTISSAANFTGTLTVQGSTLTVGTPGTTAGSINLANATSTRQVILQGLNPSGAGNATVQIPTIAGGSTDTVCLLTLANCAGTGGGVTTPGGTNGTIAMFTGANTIANSVITESGSAITVAGTLAVTGASSLTLGTAGPAGNTGAIILNNSTNANTLTLQAGATASNLTFTLPTADGTNGQCLQTNGTGGLSFGGCTGGAGGGVTSIDALTGVVTLNNSTGSGSAITIDDASTSQKGIAKFNSTNFTASAGTINTAQDINTGASPTFANLTVGNAGVAAGTLKLANATNTNLSIISATAPTGVGNATYSLPAIAGGTSDTICIFTLANCAASGTAGGDLTGTYPNPTIASLQGTTLTLSGLASGDVLQYNGTAIVNGHITNSNLTAGTFSSITGTGALSAGSIASGFGTISTTNNITTTATVQGGTLNGTSAINLNGANINTAGTLTNVAYKNQANTFTQPQTVNATSTATSGTVIGTTLQETASPASASTGSYYGSQSSGIYSGTASTTGIVVGAFNLGQQNAGTGVNVAQVYGAYNKAFYNTAGTTTTLVGSLGYTTAGTAATGSVTNAVGLQAILQNNSTAGAAWTNAYGVYVNTPTASATGTITSDYGVYVQAQAGTGITNAYGLYQAGASDLNILAGNTRIGSTTAPSYPLDVTGNINATTGYYLNGTQIVDSSRNLANIGTITSGLINGQTISSSANFTGTLAVKGSTLTVGTAGATAGSINLANATNTNLSVITATAPTGVGNATYTLPAIAGGTSDTICLLTAANCSATGTAGGDLTGTYPNPTIASLQGTTLTLSGLTSGDVLQYNGSAIVNGHITNSNLTAGTFSSITGTGALSAGSIASGFGSISTGNNITTTATVQGATVNATGTIQLNGTNINTAGTLTNVAYLNQANTFTQPQTVNATSTATSGTVIGSNLNLSATPSGASTAAYYANDSKLTYNGTASNTGLVMGALSIAQQNASAGNISNLYGGEGLAQILGAGTVSNALGMYGVVGNNSTSTGNVTNAIGLQANVGNSSTAGATFSNAYGLYVTSPTASATGTIGTDYGVYIAKQNGTGVGTAYGLYQVDTGDKNILAGNTRIGSTTAPTQALDVTGNINATTGYYLNGTQIVDSSRNLLNIGTITSGNINSQTISSAANFTGTVAVATSVSVPTVKVTSGSFAVSISSAAQANNVALSVPADTNATDTFCLASLNNCTAIGSAGGDLTGSYPNPTIAKLQGTTLTLSSLVSGDVLQYNGSAIVNGHITNSNLTAGTFSSITGTGALSAGSIATGFGTISTGNNITTTATVQGGIVNAVSALELNGTDINSAGTLSNVAYLNQSNNFTGVNLQHNGNAVCDASNNCNYAPSSGGAYLAKNATDTSSAAITATNNLYTFTNSSSAIASGVLKLNNGTNTNSTLTVTASGNPTSGQALIFASNTNASPIGNLIDLQSGSSPTSKFSVTAAGNLTAAGTINGATISGGTLTATAVNSLNVSGTAISGTGALTVDANGANTVSIGGISTGDVLLAGGSGSTGCTVTNATGALTCAGNISGPATGTVGYWTRSGTTLQPATAGDAITTTGNISTTGSGTLSVAGTSTLTGNVGIGTSPSTIQGLTVAESFGSSPTDQSTGERVTVSASPSANFNGIYSVSDQIIIAPATGTSTGYANGNLTQSFFQGSGGTVMTLFGIQTRTGVSGTSPSGTVTTGMPLYVDSIANFATGTPSVTYATERGLTVANQGAGSGTNGLTIQNAAGVAIADTTLATNRTNLLIGQISVPTGTYSVYDSSTMQNVFAGNTRIGGTTNPSYALDVTGDINTSTQYRIGGNVQLTAGALTLTNAGVGTIDSNGANNISINGTSTGDVLLAGGSGSTGCTVTNATGALTCAGNISGPATGTVGYWTRSGTTLQPATAGDAITTTGNISTTGSGTLSVAGTTTLTGTVGIGGTGPVGNVEVYNIGGGTATANGAVLSGYDANPTFNTGTFTGLNASALLLTTMGKSGTGTIDKAAELWVGNAPTIGTNNYAVYLQDTGGTAAGGITFGGDTQLYRSNVGELTTNGDLVIQGGDLLTNQTTFNLVNTTATTLNVGGAATTAVNIGPGGATGTSVNLAGGSGATGCTVDGATGNLTCSGNITGGSTGTAGYWTRSGTTLSPATTGDNVTTSGNISTTGSGTITSAGQITGSASTTGLALTGTPAASATSSLVQLGGAIAGGNTTANGGTYIGLNEPASGAGSAADYVNFETNGTSNYKIDNGGNVTQSGNLTVNGTGSSYIKGALALGTANPQAGSALTIPNGQWLSAVDSGGSSYINMFQVNSSNQIQVGAALNIDSGIVLPTDGGQLTFADLPISAATIGTPESYTFRVGSTNALTVYGEADGSGNAQNLRVAIGSSITPAYTLDVGGDVNVSSGSKYRINGADINTAGTLTNVAYLNQANNFSAANTFSAAGTALSVTNNASIGGTLSVTSTINGATITGGSLSSSAVNGLSVSGGTITNPTIAGTVTGSGSPGITGFGTISAGTYNGQTISSTANFTGTVTVQGASALTLGTASTNTGAIVFKGSAGAGTLTLQGPSAPGGNTLNLPNESGTLCSTGSVCTGYAPSTGGNYIAKNAQDTSSASVAGNLLALTNTNTGAAGVLSLTNSGTNSALSITQTGTSEPSAPQALIMANNNTTTPTGNLLDLQNKGTSELHVDVSGNLTTIGNIQGVNLTSTSNITVGALGTTNTATYLCRNSSNIIAACNTTGTGAAFVQGGNSFGATAVLGTNDANGLNIRTNGTTALSFDTSQNATFAKHILVPSSFSTGNDNPLQRLDQYPYLEHGDELRFKTPTAIEQWNGSSWITWSSPPDFGPATDGRGNTNVSVPNTVSQFRLTYHIDGICQDEMADIGQGYQPDTFNVTFEDSPDGTTWTTESSATGLNGYQNVLHAYGSSCNSYIRITFNVTTFVDTAFTLNTLELISTRPDSQGGLQETLEPYSWDYNKDITVQPVADSTSAFLVETAGGTSVLKVDTTDQAVSIGNITPSATFPLQVNGNIRSATGNFYLDGGHDLRWGDSTTYLHGNGQTSSGYLQATVNSTQVFYANASGQVSIGTASPANSLLTVGTNTTAASGGIYFGTDTNLYRGAANQLKTDSQLLVATTSNPVDGALHISSTVTNASAAYLARIDGTINGAGGGASLAIFNTLAPTANATVIGIQDAPTANPSVAIGSFWGLVSSPLTGSGTGSLTNLIGINTAPPSYGTIKPTNSTGVSIGNYGTAGITTNIGLDVAAQTAASTNIGVRIAAAGTYALQLSDTGGTAAGGITFGTDTNLYRSTTNTLKTDDNLIVAQLLTGQLGATISGAAINLNASSNFATNINTGNSTGAVTIGNTTSTSTVTINGGAGAATGITLQSGTNPTALGAGSAISVTAGKGGLGTGSGVAGTGGALNLTAGAGGDNSSSTADTGAGGSVNITAGTSPDNTGIAGGSNGGNVTITAGNGGAGCVSCFLDGNGGNVVLKAGSGLGGNGTVQLQNAAGAAMVNVSDNILYLGVTGSTATAGTVHLADTTGAAQTVTVGSTNGASATTIQGGTGNITMNGDVVAKGASTATTATTSGTGTNTTTVTLTAGAFSNGDVIFIDNAGQDYFTRITAGGGTTSLTVNPAVTYENARTVTKYNVQYLGSDGTNFSGATRNANSFFQGYFTGGVVTGAGSTTYSDGNINSVNALKVMSASTTFQDSADSTTAFQVQNAGGTALLTADTSNNILTVNQSGLNITPLSTPGSLSVSAGANTGGSLSGGATTYYYKVTAANGGGESLTSSEQSIAGSSFTALSAPGAPTGVAVAGSGLGIGNYLYKITVVTANGETTAGTESATITTTSGNQAVTLTLPAIPTGATGFRVYRTAVGGASGTEKNIYATGSGTCANNPVTTTTCTDTSTDGSRLISPPASNTARTNLNKSSLTWSSVSGATSYNIYRGTSAGGEATLAGTSATTSFTDTGGGSAGTPAAPPGINFGGDVNISRPAVGSLAIQSTTNSTTAFQIQNASGTSLLTVDTTNSQITASANQTIFQNSSNSTTAFQIQNASGTNLLSADTSNSQLSVGGSLVLSTSTAGGGSGANGGTGSGATGDEGGGGGGAVGTVNAASVSGGTGANGAQSADVSGLFSVLSGLGISTTSPGAGNSTGGTYCVPENGGAATGFGDGGGGANWFGGNGGAGKYGGGGGGASGGVACPSYSGGAGGQGVLVISPTGGTDVFKTSGTSYTVPAGVTSIKIWAVGAGGGGAGVPTGDAFSGGGGGAGAIAYRTFSVVAGTTISYSLGTGGGGGTGAANGTGGGNTTVTVGAITMTANGGSGGQYNNNTTGAGGTYSGQNTVVPLQIQNSSGTNMLSVDTTNSEIKVSGSASTSGGAPLTLINTGATAGKYWNVGPESSNNFHIYNQAGTGQWMADGGTTWNANSDERLKTNITSINDSDALSKLIQLNPVTYNWKDVNNNPDVTHLGFLAQDVQQLFPTLVSSGGDVTIHLADGSTQTITNALGVDYTSLIVPTIAAVKELNTNLGQVQLLQGDHSTALTQINTNLNNINGKIDTSGSNVNISADTNLQSSLAVGGTLTAGNITANGSITATGLNVSGGVTASDLQVTNAAAINSLNAGTLSVTGSTTLASLHVTGSAIFDGDITVGGHIITAGGQPTAQVQTAAGAVAANDLNGQPATVTITGNDTTGTITITTSDNPTAGDLVKILFSKAYGAAPHIVLSPSNDKAAGLRFFKGATSTTDFIFDALDTPQANTTYTFDYFIAQ